MTAEHVQRMTDWPELARDRVHVLNHSSFEQRLEFLVVLLGGDEAHYAAAKAAVAEVRYSFVGDPVPGGTLLVHMRLRRSVETVSVIFSIDPPHPAFVPPSVSRDTASGPVSIQGESPA